MLLSTETKETNQKKKYEWESRTVVIPIKAIKVLTGKIQILHQIQELNPYFDNKPALIDFNYLTKGISRMELY